MTGLYRKVGKVFLLTTYILLLFFFLWQIVLGRLINEFVPLGPIYTDVTKRIESPDHTKTALLIRRSGWDLNFAVKIKEGLKTTTLHWTGDFRPNLSADWNEQLIWSNDSSFLVMTLEEPSRRQLNGSSLVKKYVWAHDFKDNKEYIVYCDKNRMEYSNIDSSDIDTIIRILNSRSKEDKTALIKPSRQP